MPVIKCSKADAEKYGGEAGKWRIGEGRCQYTTKAKAEKAYKAYLAKKGEEKSVRAEEYECECIECGYTMTSAEHCNELTCPECGGKMRRKSRPGPGRKFAHDSTLVSPEAQWNSIAVDRLPEEAFAAGRSYPHHYVVGGRAGEDKRYTSGKLYLHKGGLIEARRQAGKDRAAREVIDHLDQHFREAGIETKTEDRENIYQGITGEVQMKGRLPRIDEVDLDRIIAKIDLARSRSGVDIENRELEVINSIARRDLKKEELFVFPVWASNDLPDSYFTRMDRDTTLRNFVSDFAAGRGLMISHAAGMFLSGSPAEKMPIGSSFQSEIKTRSDKAGTWVETWLYMLRDIKIGDLNTNDAIRMIEAGIWNRVSVGFTIQPIEGRPQGKYVCEICDKDLLGGECDHIPGFEYDGKVCVVRIVGGGIREISLVYMNAAQGTVVQKARMLAEAGKLDEKSILSLEMSYGVRFYDTPSMKKGIVVPGKEEPGRNQEKISEEKRKMEELRAILTGLAGMFSKAGLRDREMAALSVRVEKAKDEAGLAAVGTELAEEAREILNEVQGYRELVDAIPEDSRSIEGVAALLASAEDGRAHREAVIVEALAEGVRFEGEGFDTEHWKETLSRMTVETIGKQRDIWKKQADSRLERGRRSTDGEGDGITAPGGSREEEPPVSPGVPDDAFRYGRSYV